jgi:uncharacterized membrane protein YgdD (TMEM256/DUF423 family)
MQRTFYTTASLLAATAVIFGAFGAHSLRDRLPADMLQAFETGVRYQFNHSLALFIAGYFSGELKNKFPRWAGICFMIGILFFSGSLYLLSTRDITGLSSYKWLGPITPLGGLFLISGWILLAIGFQKRELAS